MSFCALSCQWQLQAGSYTRWSHYLALHWQKYEVQNSSQTVRPTSAWVCLDISLSQQWEFSKPFHWLNLQTMMDISLLLFLPAAECIQKRHLLMILQWIQPGSREAWNSETEIKRRDFFPATAEAEAFLVSKGFCPSRPQMNLYWHFIQLKEHC